MVSGFGAGSEKSSRIVSERVDFVEVELSFAGGKALKEKVFLRGKEE